MGKVLLFRRAAGRPLFVTVICLLCTYVSAFSPKASAVLGESVVVPKIVGTDYNKVTFAAAQVAAPSAQFQIIVPTTAFVSLNEAIKDHIDQQVQAFVAALPITPAIDGFLHQLRIVPRVDYASDTAVSITLEIDEYHPIHDVTTRYSSWLADAGGVHQDTLTTAEAQELTEFLGLKDQTLTSHSGQPYAFGLLPSHQLRLYRSDFLAGVISEPYKDINLNSVRSMAGKYHKTFYNSYQAVVPVAAQKGLQQQYKRALAKDLLVTPDCNLQSCVALTFDDGPHATLTPKVLDILASKNIIATFFEQGTEVHKHPDITRQVIAQGHEVENHSYGHPDFVKLKHPELMRREIDTTQAELAATGAAPKFFRPPYGSVDDVVRRTVNMPFIFWNVDAQEWRSGNDAQSIARSILAQARPGAIILMHDTKPLTPEALPVIINTLTQRGYKFVTVEKLLQIDGNARGDFRSKQ